MADIPCPQCKRILNLPDGREIEWVACPMCKHAFAPPATPRIVPSSIDVSREVVRPHFDPSPDPVPLRSRPPAEDDEDRPAYSDKDEGQKALESAAGFLQTMAWIGLAHTVPCCGCIGYLANERGGFRVGGGENAFVAYLCVSVLAYAVILSGARALRLQSGYHMAWTGVVVALLSSALLVLIHVPVVLSFFQVWNGPVPVVSDPCCGGLVAVPSLLVTVFGLVGGIKGLLALKRPGVREQYFREGSTEPPDRPRGDA